MKVLMGLGYYETGGFATVVDSLSKYLQEHGIDVTVAARVIKKKPPDYLKLKKLTPHEFLIEARRHDLTHIHLTYPYLNVLLKANYKHIILTHHGLTPISAANGFYNKLTILYLRYAYKRILPKIPIIIATSYHSKAKIDKFYKVNSKVIYNGVDLEIFRPIRLSERKRGYPVIFNATAWKSGKVLVKHFLIIKKYYPDAILIAVGLPQKILRQRTESIISLPKMSIKEIAYYYNLADIYLIVSRYESFGLPIIESMACGKPVVALDVDDARREHIINSGGGVLYSERDPRSLVDAISKILNNYEEFSRKSYEYATKFDWRVIAKQYIDSYNEVLNNY